MNIINKIKKKGVINSILYIIDSVVYKIFKSIYILILNRLNIKDNYVIFSSLPDFSDNSKALYEYMVNNCKNKNYKYIWLISENNNIKMDNTKFIKAQSKFHKGQTLKALYYTSISKMIFFTHGSPVDSLKLKNNQIVINLWHGCGYKAVEKGKESYLEKNYFDYALVPGNIFINNKSEFWGCKKEQILPIGYPRYDKLLNEDKKSKDYIDKLKNSNNKIVIWMPTFRKTESADFPEEKINNSYELPILNSEKDLLKLNEICKINSTVLCIKKHPYQVEYKSSKLNLSNVIFIDNKDLAKDGVDLYSILRYTDGLITDYSSIAIDYILLDKPIGFTLDDFENYSKTRGFSFKEPKKYMPGYHIYNFDDFSLCLENMAKSYDVYIEERNYVMAEVHNKCDNYCERIYREVLKILEDKNG